MLARFAITPEALAEAQCSSTAALELGIGCLNDLCRGEGVITDLREGAWSRTTELVGPLARRFLTFARKTGRLIQVPTQIPADPDTDEEWLWEALKLYDTITWRAVITHNDLAGQDAVYPVITSIERLNLSDWWEVRSPSKIVPRTTPGYLAALGLVLRHSNSLMFVDAYIDPLAENYREFPQILMAAANPEHRTLIEIHRASWRKVNGRNEGVSPVQWMVDFEAWSQQLANRGVKATVFLWERMHDRYLISDLIGINVPYGFDIGNDPTETSTWSRLGSAERDRQQMEFDPACGVHRLVKFFDIGSQSS